MYVLVILTNPHCCKWSLSHQETREVTGRRNSWNVSRCSRGLVMLSLTMLPANRTVAETSNRDDSGCALCVFLCTRPCTLLRFSARRPPRETALAHTLSLFFSPWSTREPAFTRPPTARYCKLLTALLLSAYCLLSATPSSATLATPPPFHRLWHHKITT